MLKGTGTLASKSRLTIFPARESSSLQPSEISKGRQEDSSGFFARKKSAERTVQKTQPVDGGPSCRVFLRESGSGMFEERDLCLAVSGGKRGDWEEIGETGCFLAL